jgi:hypothetical protein
VGTIDLHHIEVSKIRHIMTSAYMTQPQLAHCLICHLLLYHHLVKYQLSSVSGIHSIEQHWRSICELLENYPVVSSYGKKVDLLHSLAAMAGMDTVALRVRITPTTGQIWMTGGKQYTSLPIMNMVLKGSNFFIVMSSVLDYF